MRRACVMFAIPLFASALRADDAEARALVARAVKAVGGAEKLAKFKAAKWKGEGKLRVNETTVVGIEGTWSIQLPERQRLDLTADFGARAMITFAVDGDRGAWQKSGESVSDFSADRFAEQRENMYGQWLVGLPGLADPSVTLHPPAEVKFEGRPATVMRVSSKGRRDVFLTFDKATGLAVQSETRVKDLFAPDGEMDEVTVYSDYKDFDGFKFPTKVVVKRDGKVYMEAVRSEFQFVDKFDDNFFTKP